ncbi:MAG: hypothetical protein J4F39_06765 [Candidatus Latescibacteria bacterium]|nr:hypothetical protein [Candidatus Latescibacterota bacterium]
MRRHFSLGAMFLLLIPAAGFAHSLGADFDGDGEVGFSDFLLFAEAYGSSSVRFDLNDDGEVGFNDFVLFAADYGKVTHEEGETDVGGGRSTFEAIQDHIFNESCISSSCHSSSWAAAGLSLEPDVTYDQLVGRVPQNAKAREEGMLLVKEGDPQKSFLMTKLTGSGVGYGDRMPRSYSSLSGVAIDAIRAWIAAGAPRDSVVADAPDLDRVLHGTEFYFQPPAPPARGIQLHLKPFAIGPRSEREIFSTTRLGTAEDLMVNKIEVVQPEGSHHFILYQTTDENPPPPGVRDLDPIEALGIFRKQFVVGSQSPKAVFDFPDGTAIPMPADATYELNSHFVNASGENTLIGEVYVNLHTIPADSVNVVAKPIFVSNFGIRVPPGQTATTGQDWTLRQDVNVIMLSSHMHRHGRRFDIFLGEERIYRSEEWAEPVTLLFNPVLQVKAGERVRFECTHENDDKDFTIRFGFTAENDEMCIMLGYYY